MVIIGSVRVQRVGPSVAAWVTSKIRARRASIEVDLVDLRELALPFMDEPEHPVRREYVHQHTLDWSARVEASDAIVLVVPEYNHSYAPSVKNALDYLSQEWRGKAVGFVSYGGASSGTRGVAALMPVLAALGMRRAAVNVEISSVASRIVDGDFAANEREEATLDRLLDDLIAITDQTSDF